MKKVLLRILIANFIAFILVLLASNYVIGQEIFRGEDGLFIEVKESLNDSTIQLKELTQSAVRLNAQFKNSKNQVSYIYRDTNNGLFVVLFNEQGRAFRHWFRKESNIYSLLNNKRQ